MLSFPVIDHVSGIQKDLKIFHLKVCFLFFKNIIFLPMLNPDGVELCYKGIRSVKNKEQKRFLA